MASTSDPPDPELMNQIRKRLIETGDWDRISRSLKAHLEESGWDDDVRDMAKETARSMETPNLQALLTEITPRAKSMLGPSVRKAVVQEIEAALDREVEKA